MAKKKVQAPAVKELTLTEEQKEQREREEQIVRQIESLEFIVNGLEHHEPYQRLIEIYKHNIRSIDDAWHLTPEGSQEFRDIRNKKLAAEMILNEVPTMRALIEKLQEELVTIQNPDEIVHLNYDPN